MLRTFIFFASALLFFSCIPIRLAPSIKDYKLTKGKRFKKGLPKRTVFVFEDPKNENEFYNYINTKFKLNDYLVDEAVPFVAGGQPYYFSFYETNIPSKFINLIPLAIDVGLEKAGSGPIMEDSHSSREDSWYIAIEVFNDDDEDCLKKDSAMREPLLKYLRQLKEEYLNTQNYNEVVFKN